MTVSSTNFQEKFFYDFRFEVHRILRDMDVEMITGMDPRYISLEVTKYFERMCLGKKEKQMSKEKRCVLKSVELNRNYLSSEAYVGPASGFPIDLTLKIGLSSDKVANDLDFIFDHLKDVLKDTVFGGDSFIDFDLNKLVKGAPE